MAERGRGIMTNETISTSYLDKMKALLAKAESTTFEAEANLYMEKAFEATWTAPQEDATGWTLLCTIDAYYSTTDKCSIHNNDYCECLKLAEPDFNVYPHIIGHNYADEIEVIREFQTHLTMWGREHAEYIYMLPTNKIGKHDTKLISEFQDEPNLFVWNERTEQLVNQTLEQH